MFGLPDPMIFIDWVDFENFGMKKKVCRGFRRAEAKSSKILLGLDSMTTFQWPKVLVGAKKPSRSRFWAFFIGG